MRGFDWVPWCGKQYYTSPKQCNILKWQIKHYIFEDSSHETSCLVSLPLAYFSELAHKLTTAGCRGRTKRPFHAPFIIASQLCFFPPAWSSWPMTISFWLKCGWDGQFFEGKVTYETGTKEKSPDARALLHRKVLRNCQANCAMHAWAKPLGEHIQQQHLGQTPL